MAWWWLAVSALAVVVAAVARLVTDVSVSSSNPEEWGALRRAASWLVGLLDVPAGRFTALWESYLWKGVGPEGMDAAACARSEQVVEPAALVLGKAQVHANGSCGGYVRVPLTFASRSHMHDLLPVESQTVVGELVAPLPPASQWPPPDGIAADTKTTLRRLLEGRSVVVHLPMTGDTGLAFRRYRFAQPLLSHGVASISLIAPFYASRRPQGWRGQAGVASVAHMRVMGTALASEAVAVARLARECGAARIAYNGLSLGHGMASLACLWDSGPSACVGMVGGDSPRAFECSVLRNAVRSKTVARHGEAMWAALRSISTKDVPVVPSPCRVVRSMYAAHDHFVLRDQSDALWATLVKHSANHRRRCVPGGHLAAVALHNSLLISEIVDALSALPVATPRSASK